MQSTNLNIIVESPMIMSPFDFNVARATEEKKQKQEHQPGQEQVLIKIPGTGSGSLHS